MAQYPPIKKLGLSFVELANPKWFHSNPRLAWGFYGHRYNTYSEAKPHQGFDILRVWQAEKKTPGFVFTSNVDGHFQRAGFDESRIVECHGSLHYAQCNKLCCSTIFRVNPPASEVRSFMHRCGWIRHSTNDHPGERTKRCPLQGCRGCRQFPSRRS